MNKLFEFFHHMLNPHCPDCRMEHECKNCQTLRDLLEAERYNNKQLLNSLLEHVSGPKEEAPKLTEDYKPVSNSLPWRVRQQMLEENDREKARIIREQAQNTHSLSTAELEKELGVIDDAS